jgi:O-antigen/teichoic acid export membrane protein
VSTTPPRGLARTVVRGVALAGGGYVVTQVLTLAAYLVLARLATPADFGDYAAATVLLTVGFMFAESGTMAALVQRPDRVEEAAATAVISTIAAGVGLALVALAASPLIGHFFKSDEVSALAAAASGLLFLNAIPIVPTALLQRRFVFVRRVIVQPVGIVAFGAVAIIGTARGMGAWGLLLGTYAQAVTDVVLSWLLVRWRPRFHLASVSMWRELVGYGRHVFGSNAIVHVGGQVPVAVIGRLFGAGALGQYRYANRIASLPFALTLAGGSFVIFPAFARIADDAARLRAAFGRAMRWMAAFAFPLGLILLPLGKPLMVLVFGSTWAEAGEVTMALCLIPVAGAMFSVVCEVFTANGRPELTVRLVVVQLLCMIVAMAALSPFDLIGVAAGISVGVAGGATYALALAHRVLEMPVRSIVAEIAPPLVAACLMAGAIIPVQIAIDPVAHGNAVGLLLLFVEGLLAGAIYVACLHRLAPTHLGEFRGLVRDMISRRGEPAAELDPASAEMMANPPVPR